MFLHRTTRWSTARNQKLSGRVEKQRLVMLSPKDPYFFSHLTWFSFGFHISSSYCIFHEIILINYNIGDFQNSYEIDNAINLFYDNHNRVKLSSSNNIKAAALNNYLLRCKIVTSLDWRVTEKLEAKIWKRIGRPVELTILFSSPAETNFKWYWQWHLRFIVYRSKTPWNRDERTR